MERRHKLLLVRHMLQALHMLLAAVGGLMGAVCVINLLPEASQYNAPVHKWGGVVVGALLIAAVGALLEE